MLFEVTLSAEGEPEQTNKTALWCIYVGKHSTSGGKL